MSIYMMIAIGIIALMILWFIFGYNRFVRLRNDGCVFEKAL